MSNIDPVERQRKRQSQGHMGPKCPVSHSSHRQIFNLSVKQNLRQCLKSGVRWNEYTEKVIFLNDKKQITGFSA
jgi:hypothetical protein